jgi:hypothetical protein
MNIIDRNWHYNDGHLKFKILKSECYENMYRIWMKLNRVKRVLSTEHLPIAIGKDYRDPYDVRKLLRWDYNAKCTTFNDTDNSILYFTSVEEAQFYIRAILQMKRDR